LKSYERAMAVLETRHSKLKIASDDAQMETNATMNDQVKKWFWEVQAVILSVSADEPSYT
jgi:hypothetical protein